MTNDLKFRVGSRKSELALIQTKHVIGLLKQFHPDREFEIVTMTTLGDQILDIPLPKIGEKSLFTKELESALSAGLVDFIVHSLKDLPTSLPNGMAIGATLSRENPRDALVLQKDIKHHTLATLPEGSVIGTSSLRRTAQLAKKYPHLKVENIRGNLNTRLKKLDDLGKYHAIILASAGLNRIGWTNRISKMLNADDFLYAVGQGAIAVECRANDEKTIKLLEPLYDLQTALRVIAERSFLKTLGGGCSAPVAVTSDLKMIEEKQVQIALKGAVWSLDGAEEIVDEVVGVLPVLSKIRCAECPYINGDNEIKDIECCAVCPMKTSPTEPLPKKKRIEVPSELFNDDPHEKCPVAMPIGSDFMGECPFLQGDIKDFVGHPPLNGATVETLKSGFNVCPVLKNLKAVAALRKSTETPVINGNGDKIGDNNEHLFVGLVGHKDASPSSLRKAVELGESLAKKLIEKGALAVMTEAQNTVHSQISQVVAQC
ncbi:porphobilinogen deaminase isoform X1 [Dendroctonus ponderosae]|uniref:porphobilinogen deaminase isoform X1 n=2 Tax=Dendroctonus ponderosae TaxID=77166 RepID=UPI002035D64F|nr:porphobilinogen deaminase isoform X1 [Dendroctonus ponderosae]XP_019770799.2 porphobilinogen deaminase isoform X1 [Dendroctonus ponderosae]